MNHIFENLYLGNKIILILNDIWIIPPKKRKKKRRESRVKDHLIKIDNRKLKNTLFSIKKKVFADNKIEWERYIS